jgi:hypothetical protein
MTMAETPLTACKGSPLKRILQNLNNPDNDDLEEDVPLADLSKTGGKWSNTKTPEELSTSNDKESESSETSSIENNHQQSTPKEGIAITSTTRSVTEDLCFNCQRVDAAVLSSIATVPASSFLLKGQRPSPEI